MDSTAQVIELINNKVWVHAINIFLLDVNECIIDNGGCEQSCTNSEGNFNCSCNSGYELDSNGFNCSGNYAEKHTSVFIKGLNMYSTLKYIYYALFSDIDECKRNQSECLSNSTCMNIEGNYTCPCDSGFAGDGLTGCESECCYYV